MHCRIVGYVIVEIFLLPNLCRKSCLDAEGG